MPSHIWTRAIKNDSGAAVTADPALTVSGSAEVNIGGATSKSPLSGPGVIAPGTTVEIDAPMTVSKLKSLFLSSDQPVTVYTNAADGTGGQVLPIAGTKAGQPSITWNAIDLPAVACPLTVNVTKFFVTAPSSNTAAATFRAGFILQE